MKISEIIKLLQDELDFYGDLEVVDWGGSSFDVVRVVDCYSTPEYLPELELKEYKFASKEDMLAYPEEEFSRIVILE